MSVSSVKENGKTSITINSSETRADSVISTVESNIQTKYGPPIDSSNIEEYVITEPRDDWPAIQDLYAPPPPPVFHDKDGNVIEGLPPEVEGPIVKPEDIHPTPLYAPPEYITTGPIPPEEGAVVSPADIDPLPMYAPPKQQWTIHDGKTGENTTITYDPVTGEYTEEKNN